MTTPFRVDELDTLFVGRQPILDRTLNTIGYELLFRGGAAVGSAEFVDGDVATARVLMNAMTEIGLDTLVGRTRAFVNLTARFVAQPDLLASVPTDRVVLEILEYVETDAGRARRARPSRRTGLLDRPRRLRVQATDSHRCSTSPASSSTTSPSPTVTRCAKRIDIDHAAGRLVVVERIENSRLTTVKPSSLERTTSRASSSPGRRSWLPEPCRRTS